MTPNEEYMQRCLQLASLGIGKVAPNPMVGSVIVYEDKIIGEGFHQQYGRAHAEVNAIESVSDKTLLNQSTLYVSLEPCSHFGKTPPCADLILHHKIPKVVIGCRDVNPLVAGKGIERLKQNGVEVLENIIEYECRELNKRFFTFHQKKRPYIILKWAQTHNGIIGKLRETSSPLNENERQISNEFASVIVHKMRSEEAAIMVGTNTVFNDNPSLTTRHWKGKNPVRIIIDKHLKIPLSHNVFNNEARTFIFNAIKNETTENLNYIKIEGNSFYIKNYLDHLYQQNIQSVIVEGGAQLLQSFINEKLWDEAHIFVSPVIWENGVRSPGLIDHKLIKAKTIHDNTLFKYIKSK